MKTVATEICNLDHATTAGACGAGVREAMLEIIDGIRASPGRSSHRFARQAEERMEHARSTVAAFFGVQAAGVVFCPGATYALNLAIKGVLKAGDHAIATCFEHNSVLRPLKRMEAEGCRVTFISPVEGEAFADTLEREIRPETRLVVLSHASNVTGELLPIAELAERARRRGVLVLVDAAQSAGHATVDLPALLADMVVISGHKGLLGPPGIGCLLLSDPSLQIRPLIEGGTGLESENLTPRCFAPHSFEVGTQNLPAVAGLEAAIQFAGTAEFNEGALATALGCEALRQLLRNAPDIRVLSSNQGRGTVPLVSFTVRGIPVDRVSARLDAEHDILVRAGLQCAPLIHRHLKTNPQGAVRAAFGHGNGPEAAERLAAALAAIQANP